MASPEPLNHPESLSFRVSRVLVGPGVDSEQLALETAARRYLDFSRHLPGEALDPAVHMAAAARKAKEAPRGPAFPFECCMHTSVPVGGDAAPPR